MRKKIIIILIILNCHVLYGKNLSNEKIYTPSEFMQIIRIIQDYVSAIRPSLELMRVKAIQGADKKSQLKSRKDIIDDINFLCDKIEASQKAAKYKSKTVINAKNHSFKILMLKPDIIETFIINDPLILNKKYLLNSIREQCHPDAKNLNSMISIIDQILIQHNIITAQLDAYLIKVSHAVYCSEINAQIDKINLNNHNKDNQSIIRGINNFLLFFNALESYLRYCCDNLHRARELAIQSSNGIYTEEDRFIINIELMALIDSCYFYIKHAAFNGSPAFYNKDQSYRKFSVQLDSSDLETEFILNSPNIKGKEDLLKKILEYGVNTPKAANDNIGIIDTAIENTEIVRASVGAFWNRVGFAREYQQILLQSSKNKNDLIQFLIKSIEMRLNELAIQSANGIYNYSDRNQIEMEYQELIKELSRINRLTGLKHAYIKKQKYSVLTQKKAEKEMLRLSEMFKK